MDNEKIRLNKFLARSGVCSRRQADQFIRSGRVQVDGRVIDRPGTQVSESARVAVDGRHIEGPGKNHLYLVLNKPRGVITTARDPQGRLTVLDLFPGSIRARRIFPVGRLDKQSEGLLLLTTDGDLALRMTHPGFEHPKTYLVTVRGIIHDRDLETMRSGMTLAEGQALAPVEVRIARQVEKDRTQLEMVLRQGVNRQIRRMCRDIGLDVLRLRRTALGPLRLDRLGPSKWRELKADETARLKKSVGL
jgi:23S rRNA pseudouridine2605 synthase